MARACPFVARCALLYCHSAARLVRDGNAHKASRVTAWRSTNIVGSGSNWRAKGFTSITRALSCHMSHRADMARPHDRWVQSHGHNPAISD
eukprot:scaffold193172_cov31-Tisochrysis_lutea.AAC.6